MKLSGHNFTMFDLATREVMCYFLHESCGELTANVFTTCIIDFLKNQNLQGVDRVILYSDGCGYQNRNVTLANALRDFAIENKITVEQKYLERGHTEMEYDSVHSAIERRIKQQPNGAVYVPQQYVDIIASSRKVSPYSV